MKFPSLATTSLVAAAALFGAAQLADLPKIEIVGNKFVYANNGSQFLIRGVAYQQNPENVTHLDLGDVSSYNDPLADGDACKRDVEYLAKAKTNVIRVYAVDPKKNHDLCMKTFADAGIYVVADLLEPSVSINRDLPEWNLDLYNRYTTVIDMFSNYTNVLGYFAGNEVTNNSTNTDALAFVKAAIRDMKLYIKSKGKSTPVGYSSNDDADTRVAIADYFACGSTDERADFYGINMYEWCGDVTFETSGYKDRTADFQNLTVPIFFSEYGCNIERPRKFSEIAAMYSSKMTDVWLGGIVYMYFEEQNKYGLVSVSGSSVSTLADYLYYSSAMNSVQPELATAASASALATLACPTLASTWLASTKLPPTPKKDVCDCVKDSLRCVVSSDVDEEDYGKLFGVVCGLVDCSAVSGNGTTGTYGAISFCSDKDKLSYVLNAYWKKEKELSSACDFNGSASLLASAPTPASTCASVLSGASSLATATDKSDSSNAGLGSDSSSSARSLTSKADALLLIGADSRVSGLMTVVLCMFGAALVFV